MNTADQEDTIYLIRHAQSQYNVYEHTAIEKGLHLMDYKFKEDLIDCGITPYGVEQCKEAYEIVKDLNITVVLVSPLRRAIETALNVFKNHKNKPKFKVLPMLKEILESNCDVPDDLDKIKQAFPEVDFSEMDKFQNKDMWMLDLIMDPQVREELTTEANEYIADKEDKGKAFRTFLLDKLKRSWPRVFEFGYNLVERGNITKKQIREILKDMKPGEKIAVVSHSAYLRRFYGTTFDEVGCAFDDYGFKNCEVKEYKLPF